MGCTHSKTKQKKDKDKDKDKGKKESGSPPAAGGGDPQRGSDSEAQSPRQDSHFNSDVDTLSVPAPDVTRTGHDGAAAASPPAQPPVDGDDVVVASPNEEMFSGSSLLQRSSPKVQVKLPSESSRRGKIRDANSRQPSRSSVRSSMEELGPNGRLSIRPATATTTESSFSLAFEAASMSSSSPEVARESSPALIFAEKSLSRSQQEQLQQEQQQPPEEAPHKDAPKRAAEGGAPSLSSPPGSTTGQYTSLPHQSTPDERRSGDATTTAKEGEHQHQQQQQQRQPSRYQQQPEESSGTAAWLRDYMAGLVPASERSASTQHAEPWTANAPTRGVAPAYYRVTRPLPAASGVPPHEWVAVRPRTQWEWAARTQQTPQRLEGAVPLSSFTAPPSVPPAARLYRSHYYPSTLGTPVVPVQESAVQTVVPRPQRPHTFYYSLPRDGANDATALSKPPPASFSASSSSADESEYSSWSTSSYSYSASASGSLSSSSSAGELEPPAHRGRDNRIRADNRERCTYIGAAVSTENKRAGQRQPRAPSPSSPRTFFSRNATHRDATVASPSLDARYAPSARAPGGPAPVTYLYQTLLEWPPGKRSDFYQLDSLDDGWRQPGVAPSMR